MRIAAFIDCENIPVGYAGQVFDILAGAGSLVSCQGYADFANPFHRGWQEPLVMNGTRAIHVYHNTKDDADREILIDATECAIKERRIGAVCIVSNDGIYAPLKRILHKYDKQLLVIGTGMASRSLEDTADAFFRLAGEDPRSFTPTELIDETIRSNGGIMRLADLGNAVWGLLPNYKAMGFQNMKAYVESLGFHIAPDNSYSPPVDWIQCLPKKPASA